jgi:replicative DNA helicase
MASSEQLLISKVIQEQDLSYPLKHGVKSDHFTKEWGTIWTWLISYWRTHGSVPTDRAINMEFGDIKVLDAKSEPFSALVDEMFASYRQRNLVEAMSAAMPALNAGNTSEAFKLLSAGVQKAGADVARLRDVNLIETWEARLEKYDELRKMPNAIRGIPTGINGLDRITSGFRPQQLITFVGEAKKGKSLMTLMMANAAHLHGKRPLFVSFEMSAEEQAARYDAIVAKVPYSNILRANLSDLEFEKVRNTLRMRKNMHPFIITEDTSSLTTVSSIAAKLQEYKPDILFVDGVYLMDDENGEPKGSPQALTNITRSLKRLAQTADIPIIGTTQVLSWKLGNKKSRRVTVDSIGYTSSFAQDSDLVLAVESDPDIEDQGIIRVVIARAAPQGEIRINWDWNNMDFTEVGEDGDDDDSDRDNWYH